MRAIFFITLLVLHAVTAHLHFDKVAEKVQSGLKHLKDKAVSKLHKITEDFYKEGVHKHHAKPFPQPYAKHYVKEHYTRKTPFVVDPYQIERLKHYFEPPHKPVTYHVPHYP